MFLRSYENFGLTTCTDCGVQWAGEEPVGRCERCEEAWSDYLRVSKADEAAA